MMGESVGQFGGWNEVTMVTLAIAERLDMIFRMWGNCRVDCWMYMLKGIEDFANVGLMGLMKMEEMKMKIELTMREEW
jgi:hypothetical protein